MTRYLVTFVRPYGVVQLGHNGAPTEAWMCQRGKERGASFVIRYFPKYKGWRTLDIRKAQNFRMSNEKVSIWRGQRRGQRIWPNEDAAVMACMTLLGAQPELSLT